MRFMVLVVPHSHVGEEWVEECGEFSDDEEEESVQEQNEAGATKENEFTAQEISSASSSSTIPGCIGGVDPLLKSAKINRAVSLKVRSRRRALVCPQSLVVNVRQTQRKGL